MGSPSILPCSPLKRNPGGILGAKVGVGAQGGSLAVALSPGGGREEPCGELGGRSCALLSWKRGKTSWFFLSA